MAEDGHQQGDVHGGSYTVEMYTEDRTRWRVKRQSETKGNLRQNAASVCGNLPRGVEGGQCPGASMEDTQEVCSGRVTAAENFQQPLSHNKHSEEGAEVPLFKGSRSPPHEPIHNWLDSSSQKPSKKSSLH
ncbi:hypothetical protein P7K49_020156 [Saguinus oedipus]|uniref:Uncharacterized protein n=1 Tax=Saguinus oedipus TaxID=9490 RepID=A0ABQ9V0D7_SAGOE|nr:hypothetical protein P7K49_020156 [Saguinus oedipus]